jgi:hypothetical protein
MSSTRWSRRRFHVVALIALLMFVTACGLPSASTTRAIPTVTPRVEVGQLRITVRKARIQREFYEVSTGRTTVVCVFKRQEP